MRPSRSLAARRLRALLGATPAAAPLFEGLDLEAALADARVLPARLVPAGFECRMAAGTHPVDFGSCIERTSAADLARSETNASWRRIMERWAEPTTWPWNRIPRAWVEFDQRRDKDPRAPWDRAFPFLAVSELLSGDDRPSALEALLSALSPPTTPPGSAEVEELLASLPEGAAIRHVTALAHRGAFEARLQFTAPARSALDWVDPGSGRRSEAADLARRLLQDLPVRVVAAQTRLAVGRARPYGLEITFPHGPDGDPPWRVLLGRAVEAGLASVEKVRALLEWPGHSTHLLPGEPAPIRVHRHYYVTLRVEGDPSLKAYASYSPRYVLS